LHNENFSELLSACDLIWRMVWDNEFTWHARSGIRIVDFSSYSESQRDALFLKFILAKNSTCCGQIYCPSSGVSQHCIQQK